MGSTPARECPEPLTCHRASAARAGVREGVSYGVCNCSTRVLSNFRPAGGFRMVCLHPLPREVPFHFVPVLLRLGLDTCGIANEGLLCFQLSVQFSLKIQAHHLMKHLKWCRCRLTWC